MRRAPVQAPSGERPAPPTATRHPQGICWSFYQFLSGHANIGSYLHRMELVDDDTCWWCDTGERQTRFHLVASCPAWRGQARVLWKRVAKLCEWNGPRAPEVRLLFDDVPAAPAVLSFLRDTRIGRIVPQALRRRRDGEEGREVDREGEEGGPGPP